MTRIMKNSGIPYIGIMPEDWQLLRGKYVLTKLQRPVKKEDGIVTCFRDGEVTLRSNRREDGFTMSDKEIGYQGVDIGDLVVHGMDGFAGAIGISDSRGKASPVLNVLDSVHDKRFLKYYLRSMAYGDVFTAWSTGIRVRSCDLGWNKLSELKFMIPAISEQHRIADYLDKKCASIDVAIDAGKKEVEKLKAYKQAVITKAVTKGLNPDVKMKESGIDWIGNIPESWKVSRLGYESYIRARLGWRGLKAEEYVDEGYAFISAFNIQNDLMVWEPLNFITRQRYDESPEIKLHIGDVLIVKDGAGVGKSARIDSMPAGEASPNSSLGVITPYSNLNYKYCSYYLQSSVFNNFVVRLLNGMGVPHLTQEVLKKLKILIPCIDEQVQIASFLDEKCSSINKSIACKRAQVATLEKYKKALIYACVTGKKEVPNG